MKKYYILRLDDACETMNKEKWSQMEQLLDRYKICPIVGVIPNNEDKTLIIDEYNDKFWNVVKRWEEKKWAIAMHGYNHVYISDNCGVNPVHRRSEFAGVPYVTQKEKIEKGYKKFLEKGIIPQIFFAPSHTFDDETLRALEEATDIRIISDTIASDIYYKKNFYFIPQQSGKVRNLPFKTVTFCYHPNMMSTKEFDILEHFLKKYAHLFTIPSKLKYERRRFSFYDMCLNYLYFKIRRKND